MRVRLHDFPESWSVLIGLKINIAHHISMYRWCHSGESCTLLSQFPVLRIGSTTSHKHESCKCVDEHAHDISISCDSSLIPLISCTHHPPVVSVQGEAANPGPHDEHGSHDAADEANITLFFGNVGS
eukprot:9363546-Karenia_brevis.AAC.1